MQARALIHAAVSHAPGHSVALGVAVSACATSGLGLLSFLSCPAISFCPLNVLCRGYPQGLWRDAWAAHRQGFRLRPECGQRGCISDKVSCCPLLVRGPRWERVHLVLWGNLWRIRPRMPPASVFSVELTKLSWTPAKPSGWESHEASAHAPHLPPTPAAARCGISSVTEET